MIQPWPVPDFALIDDQSVALADIDAGVLDQMCCDFRDEVFRKAGKENPGRKRSRCMAERWKNPNYRTMMKTAAKDRANRPEVKARVSAASEKWWSLKSPDGVPYHFLNLRRFITEHASLFDPDDLIPRPYNSKTNLAYMGLSSLRPSSVPRTKNQPEHWRGWHWCEPPI